MAKLTFYRHERIDNGRRTGVEYSGGIGLELFEPGDEDYDPVLTWFIDLCWEGRFQLGSVEQVRQWVLERKDEVVPAMIRLADELTAGIDHRDPLQRKIPTGRKGLKITLTVGAMRRFEARQTAGKLREVCERWEELLQSLPDARLAYTWPE